MLQAICSLVRYLDDRESLCACGGGCVGGCVGACVRA
jgi:hypothetical protein